MAARFEGVIVTGDYFANKGSSHIKYTSSCSGILLNPTNGLILTTGAILSPHLIKREGIITNVTTRIGKLIGISDKKQQLQSITPTLHANFNVITEKMSADQSRQFVRFKAKLISINISESLENEMKNLMTDNTWRTMERIEKPQFVNKQLKLTMSFVLLQIQDVSYPVGHQIDGIQKELPPFIYYCLRECWSFIKCVNQGEKIICQSSLFGELSPAVFMNSISRGIIVNKCGSLLITDARCAPGSEGGIVFVDEGDKRLWVGMIMASLCWKQRDLLGLSLVCNAGHVISDLVKQYKFPVLPALSNDIHSNVWSEALRSIVVVRTGSAWGSGIVINKYKRIILTCSHVVRNSLTVKVELHYPDIRVYEAKVLYMTPEGDVPDLAVLNIPDAVDIANEITYKWSKPKIGESVLAAGFAIFSPSCNIGVHVTSGVVSRVVKLNGEPILLQTSCSVFGGASGGLILSADTGDALGLIVCNAKDTKTNITYPTVNLAIPFASFYSVIREYLDTGDKSILRQLLNTNSNVKYLWKLGKLPDAPQSKL